MRPVGHLASSTLAALVVYWFFGNVSCALIFFFSGILMDIDHIIDYLRAFGTKGFNFTIFCQACYEARISSIWLVFHSLELLFLLWGVIAFLGLNSYWVSFALGLTFHLLLDYIFNSVYLGSYFFVYRWYNRFRVDRVFRKID